MGFGVVDEKELPEYTTADAGKSLKVDSNGVFLQWLAETSELPTQTGNAGKYLTTDGSTASWGNVSQVPTQTGATSGSLLQTNGTTASWTNAPTVSVINTGTGALTGIKWGSNTGVDGTTTGVNLRVGGVTIVGVSSNTVTSTGIINITATGSATNPSLSFGDRVAGSLSGIYANPTDDTLNFSTNSTERLKITNTTMTVTNNLAVTGNITATGTITGTFNLAGSTINCAEVQFGGTGASITGANAGANSTVNIRTESTDRVVITSADLTLPNCSLSLQRGIINSYLIVDAVTHVVSRLTPPIVILTRSIVSTQSARVQLPTPSDVPSGFGFRLYIFNLPGRNNTASILNTAGLVFVPATNNALLFDNSADIKFFAGNQIYLFATSTTTYTVLDIYNLRDWETGKHRWLVTPVSKWVEPSPATTTWLGNDN